MFSYARKRDRLVRRKKKIIDDMEIWPDCTSVAIEVQKAINGNPPINEADWIAVPFGSNLPTDFEYRIRIAKMLPDKKIRDEVYEKLTVIETVQGSSKVKHHIYHMQPPEPPVDHFVRILASYSGWVKIAEVSDYCPRFARKYDTDNWISNPSIRHRLVERHGAGRLLNGYQQEDLPRLVTIPDENIEIELYKWIHEWYLAQDIRKFIPSNPSPHAVAAPPFDNVILAVYDDFAHHVYQYNVLNKCNVDQGEYRLIVVKTKRRHPGYKVVAFACTRCQERDLLTHFEHQVGVNDGVNDGSIPRESGYKHGNWFSDRIHSTFQSS